MILNNQSLKNRCVINNGNDGNNFVGIKADTNDVLVYFPLGYRLSKTDNGIRKDILNLFNILNEFKNIKEGTLTQNNFNEETDEVEFPLNAYMDIIYYYLQYGYYKEINSIYKMGNKGKINWSKTIKKQTPLLSFNKDKQVYSPIYTLFTVKDSTPNENNEITIINQHCVYESFKKIGWIFTSNIPPKPQGEFNKFKFLIILNDKLSNTNDDKSKRLFNSMIKMIEFMDEKGNVKFYFGTEKFEYIFEKLVDFAFGIKNKDKYFPKARWDLKFNNNISTYPLQPDTIMIYNNKIFIIDSKYYKYGITRNPHNLPEATSINKQITYGEYVYKLERNNYEQIYNAFLIPYNKEDNPFELNKNFLIIGEVTGDWKYNTHIFEHIQCILIDIKYLINNYIIKSKANISKLANLIENSYAENKKINT